NTFLLLGAVALTGSWASGTAPPRLRDQGVLGGLLGISLLGVLALGVTGAIAALGDTLFPARTLAEGFRQAAGAGAHVLLRLRVLHPLLAVGVGTLLLATAAAASLLRPGRPVRRGGIALASLVVLQLLVGLLNLALLAPVWMQLVHLLLADAVWI